MLCFDQSSIKRKKLCDFSQRKLVTSFPLPIFDQPAVLLSLGGRDGVTSSGAQHLLLAVSGVHTNDSA